MVQRDPLVKLDAAASRSWNRPYLSNGRCVSTASKDELISKILGLRNCGLRRERSIPLRLPDNSYSQFGSPKFVDNLRDVIGLHVDSRAPAIVRSMDGQGSNSGAEYARNLASC